MKIKNQKAFTIIELIFVIVIIGILSAIAIPKLSSTVHQAHLTKAKTVLASVRSALSTERQKRILRGQATSGIGDLGSTNYAFQYFDNNSSIPVLQYPVESCNSEACWQRVDASTYRYHINGNSDYAEFTLTSNRLDCATSASTDSNTINCEKISK